jgi:argininosuccinate synthase
MFYDEIIKYMIFGNVTRDGYPLCVGSERLIQARESMQVALENDAEYLIHGSTGAGNDQYRFDLVIHVLGGGKIKPLAPVREHNIKRTFSQNYLKERGVSVSDKAAYSYNVGLWGVSIGGKETLVSDGLIPEDEWYTQIDPALENETLKIEFEKGEVKKLTHRSVTKKKPVEILQYLADIGGRMGIGRHYHVGTSIPGKKGRLAYQSPAADILYAAHSTLEKLTLSQSQIFFKKNIANEYGRLVHEAKIFDPLLEDIKAFLQSSQRRVTGECTVHLTRGTIAAVTAKSPFDLLGAGGSEYGEFSDAYTGQQAEGSALINAYEQSLYARVGGKK